MRPRRRVKSRLAKQASSELDLMPMINVFIAIIPLLLLSAAFVPVTVIKTTLPAGGAVAEAASDASLDLAIVIQPQAYVLNVNGAVARTIPRPGPEAQSQLTGALQEVAAAHPGHREVRIVSLPTTLYEEIIQVMDVARAAGLPEAALADGGAR
jgi:biopolymer transport protein ExbD